MTDWYPRYPSLYRLDTLHLSLAEHGAYNLLIDWYMDERRPIPDDDRAIARILGVGLDDWLVVATNVRGFFRKRGAFLHHKRCDAELDAQDKRGMRRSEKARKAASIRHANKNNDVDAMSTLQAVGEHEPSNGQVPPEQEPSTSQAAPEHGPSMLGDATGHDSTVQNRESDRASLSSPREDIGPIPDFLSRSGVSRDWQPNEAVKMWAWHQKFAPEQITAEADGFRAWSIGNGKSYADVDEAFKSWLIRSRQFAKTQAQQPPRRNGNGMTGGHLRHMSIAQRVELRKAEEAKTGKRMNPAEYRQFLIDQGVNPDD